MLKEKIILITGSSSGIGLASARAAIKEGARVILHGSRLEKLEKAAESLGSVPHVAGDLSKPDMAEQVFEKALKIHGRIDVLVNNAAIFPRTSLEEADGAKFDRIFAINTRSPLLFCRRFVKEKLAEKTPGTIVNIGSVNAYCGQPDLLLYSMSKGALMTMSKNIADAYAAHAIRVNQLNVGWTLTETEIKTQRQQGRPDNWQQEIPRLFAPAGRILAPEEVARHVVFWASDLSAPVTGQVYDVEQYTFVGRNVMSRLV